MLLAGFLFLAFGDDGAARPQAEFSSPTLQPEFSPDRRNYVARCAEGRLPLRVRTESGTTASVDGGEPRSGEFAAGARVAPGEDFRVIATRQGREESWKVRCLPDGFP